MADLKYDLVDINITMPKVNIEVSERWKEKNITARILNLNSSGKHFVFLEGPPTANGRPHIGHAMTRTLKDVFLRYKTMRGYRIERRTGGWDCHGLPVEIEAEKHFGIKSKKEIEDLGVEKFNAYCRESVFKYIDEWMEMDTLLGFSVDHKNAYVTLKPEYIESEWWAMKNLFDRKLLEKDYKIVPYCPRCGTSLSSHEVAQGYEEVKDPSVYVKFRIKGFNNRYLLAWTTTPWTLPSNEFLAVNPEFDYVLVKHGNEELYLVRGKVDELLSDGHELIKELRGIDLLGMQYEQLIPMMKAPSGTMRVVAGSFVGKEEGTGIVHVAPAFGSDDFDIGKREHVKMLNPVDLSGKFASSSMPWNGMFVKDADREILKYLKDHGLLFKSTKIEHTYPFCYRCKSPLLYYPLETWFIRVSRFRKEISENNQKINWFPETLKNGRFGNFLEEAKDWSLSRNRYWGTPLPVWTCFNGHSRAVGSFSEIENETGFRISDPHVPYIDSIILKCKECGQDMRREPYVIDTWFDSGSATYAAMHYPFSHKFNPDENLPVDYISEAIDQTRGWFYVLHVISTLLFEKNAYSNVLTIEFVLDDKGRKMSKSQGNFVLATDLLKEIGADPLRLFFLTGLPWKTRNLDRKFIGEISRRSLYTLLNVYSFFSSNANLDSYTYRGPVKYSNIMDRYLMSRLNTTISRVTAHMDSFMPHLAYREIEVLIDEFSNFYLRLSRERFWSGSIGDKDSSYNAVYSSLMAISRMLAPFAPFFSDYLYTRLNGPEDSVHLDTYPESDDSLLEPELEKQMTIAYSVIETARRTRQAAKIKGRQPVQEILIFSPVDLSQEIISSISAELNSKRISLISGNDRPVRKSISIVKEKAAPIVRSEMPSLMEFLSATGSEGLVAELETRGSLSFKEMQLPRECFVINEVPVEGYAYSRDERTGVEIFINTSIDQNLVYEGISREIIRRIQVMRKEMNLNYDEKISVILDGTPIVIESMKRFMKEVSQETLADRVRFASDKNQKSWDIDGEKLQVLIERI
jgi:isoleucyl-tRNA synthetase